MENEIQMSLSELTATFLQRMESFEGKLAKTTHSTPSAEVLAKDFSEFKSFMLNSLRAIQIQMKCLANSVENLEIRSRRKFLLLHGVTENNQEEMTAAVVKILGERMKKTSINVADLSRTQRMGRAVLPDKPRPILCKFKDISLRDKIWSSKSDLKGSGITLSEFLTRTQYDIFIAARQRYGVSKCWTRQGFVYIVGTDGVRHRVNCVDDLEAIQPKVATKPAAVIKERALSKTRRAAASKK